MFYFIPRLFQKNWIHILVWAAMLFYVAAAPPFHSRYILKDGKPVSYNEELPQRMTKRISYKIERIDPVVIRGQNLYQLWGWSFLKGEPDQSVYERLIVLQSDSRRYLFISTNKARPDVQAEYADLQLDLSNSGFSSYISKDIIEHGTYQIGILLKNRDNGKVYYLVTHKIIIRTANKLQLISP